jgi:6-phosphogluconolactonase
MRLRTFNTFSEMSHYAVALLIDHFTLKADAPHAVLLTGGTTAPRIYQAVLDEEVAADDNLHLLISDERHVPTDSPHNNYAQMIPMIHSLGAGGDRVHNVNTELPLADAAECYHSELQAFVNSGGRITLAMLGLGSDGHVASLFSMDDVLRCDGTYAIPVEREVGPDRISVTAELLSRSERIVFLVVGEAKKEAVDNFIEESDSMIAWRAVKGVDDVELWYTQTAE